MTIAAVPPSLSRIALTLEPSSGRPVPPTAWAIHAALHRLIERSAPTYAGRLHEAMPKPLSLSAGDLRDGRLDVTLGLLENETIDQVGSILGRAIALATPIELDRVPWRVASLRRHPVGNLQHALTYQELVRRTAPAATVRLAFLSPATIRNDRRSFASAEPRHVFGGGFLQRWRAFSGEPPEVDISPGTMAGITLADGDIREQYVRMAKFGANAFTGWTEYRAGDPAARKTLAVLAAFAAFAGVGARTAYGLGHVERIS